MEFDPEVAWYYSQGRDVARLRTTDKLEAERTRRIIESRLPGGLLDIVDIGGGAGAYAFWLAQLGHAVSLVDPIELHIEQARANEREVDIALASTHEAAAGALPFDDDQFDVALLLGPLYHLPDRSDRLGALREAKRVLRPGGLLFGAAISRYSWLTRGFFRDLATDNQFWGISRSEVRDGKHTNPDRRRGLFTTAYFHLPDELYSELGEAGLVDSEVLAIESVFSSIPDFDDHWDNDAFRARLLEALEEMEHEPSIQGLAGHLMGIARCRAGPSDRVPQIRPSIS